jgi:hypothetical protein
LTDILRVEDEYYVRASSALADDRTRVLKHGDTFAIFNLCFARIKSAFKMNNIQRADVTLLHLLWMTKLQFARHSCPLDPTLSVIESPITTRGSGHGLCSFYVLRDCASRPHP